MHRSRAFFNVINQTWLDLLKKKPNKTPKKKRICSLPPWSYFLAPPLLPCAHNFHVESIDNWLKLTVKCPRWDVLFSLVLTRMTYLPSRLILSIQPFQLSTSHELRVKLSHSHYLIRMQSSLTGPHIMKSPSTPVRASVQTLAPAPQPPQAVVLVRIWSLSNMRVNYLMAMIVYMSSVYIVVVHYFLIVC